MSMDHGSFDTTMKYYTGVPADLQKQAAEALGELPFGPQNTPAGGGHIPATPPSNPEDLEMLKAELQQNSCK
jgi:hypothetical protein